MAFIHKILLTCKDATLLTCKQQEDSISIKERIQLEMHLWVCKVCTLFNIQSNQLHQHLRQKINQEDSSFNFIKLGEEKKNVLQHKIDIELQNNSIR